MDGDERAPRTADQLEAALMDAWFDAASPLGLRGEGGETRAFERRSLAGGRVRLYASAAIPHSLANRAVGLGSAAPGQVEELIGAVERFLASRAGAGLWLDLPAIRSPRWDAWLASSAALPTGAGRHVLVHRGELAPIARNSLRISRIAPHEAPRAGALLARGLGLPSEAATPFGSLAFAPGWHVFVARDADRPVAAATLFVRGDEALLGPVATEPAERRRGAHVALLATLIRAAADLGCRALFATVPDAGSGDGTPVLANLARCGFRLLATTAGFAVAAPRSATGAPPLRSPRHPRERRRESAHVARTEADDRTIARDR